LVSVVLTWRCSFRSPLVFTHSFEWYRMVSVSLRFSVEACFLELINTTAKPRQTTAKMMTPIKFFIRATACRAEQFLASTEKAAKKHFAWRNLAQTADLQIRLVRASELNSHLKQMNLAAAGLVHETRPQAVEIVNEADRVAAQLNEFINYSRPREVRRTTLQLNAVTAEVVRALSHDLEEKQIHLHVTGDPLAIEADEQLLRQVLFNLLLNAIQAVTANGEIEIHLSQVGGLEAQLEVRDNGPGVPPENRAEIFKAYFTTTQKGTGLGLGVVQQIVLAHGWEIECLANEPRGAIFRLTHLKLAAE